MAREITRMSSEWNRIRGKLSLNSEGWRRDGRTTRVETGAPSLETPVHLQIMFQEQFPTPPDDHGSLVDLERNHRVL